MSGASSCCCGDDGKEGGNIRTTDLEGLSTFLFTFVKGPISEVEYRLWFMGGDMILLACLLAFLGSIFKFYALRFYVFISLTFSSSSRFTFSSLESCVIGVILYIFLHSILAYNPQSPPIQPNILIYSTHIPPSVPYYSPRSLKLTFQIHIFYHRFLPNITYSGQCLFVMNLFTLSTPTFPLYFA